FLLLTKAIIVFMTTSSLQSVPTPCAVRRTCIFLETRRWNVMTTRVQIHSFACTSPNAGRCWASPLCNLTNIRMGN
ncbi:hypothetical protein L210DRAFT_3555122, partial [Boletus edulis BED1]